MMPGQLVIYEGRIAVLSTRCECGADDCDFWSFKYPALPPRHGMWLSGFTSQDQFAPIRVYAEE